MKGKKVVTVDVVSFSISTKSECSRMLLTLLYLSKSGQKDLGATLVKIKFFRLKPLCGFVSSHGCLESYMMISLIGTL